MQRQESVNLSLSDRLIVAMDVRDLDKAKRLVDELTDLSPVFKFGYHNIFSGGLDLARNLARQGVKVFLDAKLHDIPKTVEGGTRSLAHNGFWCMTAHANYQNIKGAVTGAEGTDLKILGVTVLTSMDKIDLEKDGIKSNIADQVLVRSTQALNAGAHGLIASPLEVAALRKRFGDTPLIITPGIRPVGSAVDDQVRITTPKEAIKAGADALVIGRPILGAPNPLDAASAILDQIHSAI
ncbi:MAG: orotidine-5'-phosphate decarboxylase [Alphaproteobacteria bacterium]